MSSDVRRHANGSSRNAARQSVTVGPNLYRLTASEQGPNEQIVDESGQISVMPLHLDRGDRGLRRCHARARDLLHHELGFRQLREMAAARHQFIESSALDHAAVLEYQNPRGV